ncbi:tetratricopeptide repeat protein [Fundidesulfovibrio butyratiphilus]
MTLTHVKLNGIFSQSTEVVLGSGSTRRKVLSQTLWFVREHGADTVEVRSLDLHCKPQGGFAVVDKREVLEKYTPEPQLTYKHLSKPLMTGDTCRENRDYRAATLEYEKVRAIDEANIRANFGLGISLLALGQLDKALYVFHTLLELEETFAEEHKHLFNEMGIRLRRRGLFDETLRYYFKALAMTSLDENLLFNIARAYHEKGDTENAVTYLANALDSAPGFEEGLRFGRYLWNNGMLSLRNPTHERVLAALRAAGQLD